MSDKVTYVCVTQNRVENLKRNLPLVIPFVDRVIIIDGGSYDLTEEFCKSLSPKVEWYYRKWDDSFANQYNEYLKYITDGWVLITDDDELPSENMLKSLRPLVEASNNGDNFSCVEFRSWSINADDEIPKDHPDDHWRKMFFKFVPGMRYCVDLHQCLIGYKNSKHIRCNEHYYHIKTKKDTARNACRNYFIAGIWISGAADGQRGPEWQEYRDIVLRKYPNVKTFNDLDKYLVSGDVDSELKDWIVRHKDFGNNLYHELHHYYEYYFDMLHPEEKTDAIIDKINSRKASSKKFSFSIKSDIWNAPGDSRELGIAIRGVSFTLNGVKTDLQLINPNLELSGFNGVEQTSGGVTFSWSSGYSTISIHGIDFFPDELVLYLLWPVDNKREAFLILDEKELQITGYGICVRKKGAIL